MKITSAKQLAVYIDNPPAGQRLGTVGEALKAALAKRKEQECSCAAYAEKVGIAGITVLDPNCPIKEHRDEYDLHELACNICEDLDNGAIFGWRLEQVKEHLAAGGTTGIDGSGNLYLYNPAKSLSVRYEDDLCPGCAAAVADGIQAGCGGKC